MQMFYVAKDGNGLSLEEIREAVAHSLEGKSFRKALLIPPDYTRYYSNAGLISNIYYHFLSDMGCHVDVLPALGTHAAMTEEEAADMFGDIPFKRFIVHSWRSDVVCIGQVSGEYLATLTDGLWSEPLNVEINRLVMDPSYDLVLSIGQVVPHEVIGMSNHAKNLFVGVGGSDMINKSHMVGAVYGMERMMGRDFTPVRRLFDYSLEHFLASRPILFALTVCTVSAGVTHTHGLFVGDTRTVLEEAIALAQCKNIDFVEQGIKKCIVYLDPREYRSTWLGNKSIYRTRMAIADGGELLVLAPGIDHFGEDAVIDGLIRKYGYCGRLKILEMFRDIPDLQANMGAAAHLIHGSSDGRFSITYAVKPHITRTEIEGVNFGWADYDKTVARYDPEMLNYGYNTLPDGEEVYFIPNPALGLWIDRSRFTHESGEL